MDLYTQAVLSYHLQSHNNLVSSNKVVLTICQELSNTQQFYLSYRSNIWSAEIYKMSPRKKKSTNRSPSRPSTAIMAQYSMALQDLQSSVDAYKASLSPTEDELHEHKEMIEKDLERFELRANNALQFSGEMEDVQAAMQTLGREAKILLTRIDTALRKTHQATAQVQNTSQPGQENNSMAKLPTISLPQFNGSFEHWLSFIDQFDSAIENNGKLSKVQKLVYLKRCLRGSAEKLI